jgi:hypothetical protein
MNIGISTTVTARSGDLAEVARLVQNLAGFQRDMATLQKACDRGR